MLSQRYPACGSFKYIKFSPQVLQKVLKIHAFRLLPVFAFAPSFHASCRPQFSCWEACRHVVACSRNAGFQLSQLKNSESLPAAWPPAGKETSLRLTRSSDRCLQLTSLRYIAFGTSSVRSDDGVVSTDSLSLSLPLSTGCAVLLERVSVLLQEPRSTNQYIPVENNLTDPNCCSDVDEPTAWQHITAYEGTHVVERGVRKIETDDAVVVGGKCSGNVPEYSSMKVDV